MTDISPTLGQRQRQRLTDELSKSPYNPLLWAARARAHLALSFPDLAVGDAYRGILLLDNLQEAAALEGSDESEDEDDEILRTGREARGAFLLTIGSEGGGENEREQVDMATEHCTRLLVYGLIKTGSYRDAAMYAQGLGGGLEVGGLDLIPAEWQVDLPKDFNEILQEVGAYAAHKDKQVSRRVKYEWNTYEPDRYTRGTVDYINKHMVMPASDSCEVRTVDLPELSEENVYTKHLGVFATREIAENDLVLHEESALSIVVDPVNGGLCDYCGAKCFPSEADQRTLRLRLNSSGSIEQAPSSINLKDKSELFHCPNCTSPDEGDEDFLIPAYCSPACLQKAQSHYHPILCRSSRLLDLYRTLQSSLSAPSTTEFTSAAAYSLLLLRTFSIALHRHRHPLLLNETRYLYGVSPPSTTQPDPLIPWSFTDYILQPIRIFEALRLDTFANPWTELWVVNTLFAKFRGVASARMDALGRTEAAAVHTVYSMFNHDCGPNVKWSCAGTVEFWARRKVEKGKELFISYCDVGLGVRERGEWMMGCLGGKCRCERCEREEREEKEGEEAVRDGDE